MRRLCLRTLAAVGVDALVLVWFPLWGVCLRITPAVVFLTGAEEGSDRGAGCGFLAGCLTALLGASPWQIALLTSLGTLAGEVFHKRGTFWGKCGKVSGGFAYCEERRENVKAYIKGCRRSRRGTF